MLNAKKLALSGAIVWSIFVFLFIIFVLLTGSGLAYINSMLSSFISSYRLNWTGAFVIFFLAFIDAFIFFYLFASIYNFLNKEEKKVTNLYSNEE